MSLGSLRGEVIGNLFVFAHSEPTRGSGNLINVDEEFTVKIYVKNRFPPSHWYWEIGDTTYARFKDVKITAKATRFAEIVRDGGTIQMGDLNAGDYAIHTVTCKALEAIETPFGMFAEYLHIQEPVLEIDVEAEFDIERFFTVKISGIEKADIRPRPRD